MKLYAHSIDPTTYPTNSLIIHHTCIKLLWANFAWYFLKFSPLLHRIFILVSLERGSVSDWQWVQCVSDAFMLAWYSLTHTSRQSHSIYQGQIDSHASAILRPFHTPYDGVQMNRLCVCLLMPLRRLDGVCGLSCGRSHLILIETVIRYQNTLFYVACSTRNETAMQSCE